MGRATRRDQRSGARTASVLGTTSQPTKISAKAAASKTSVIHNDHPPLSASQSGIATMAALATVLPSTMVASKSCGSASKRATTPPVWRERSAN